MSDLRVKCGDAIKLAVGPLTKADGSVQPLAGLTIRFTAKDRLDDLDDDAVLKGSTLDGKVALVGDGSTGEAVVTIPSPDTAGLLAETLLRMRVLHWDVQVASGDGTIGRTIDSGLLYVERDVTRTSP